MEVGSHEELLKRQGTERKERGEGEREEGKERE